MFNRTPVIAVEARGKRPSVNLSYFELVYCLGLSDLCMGHDLIRRYRVR